VDVRRVAPLRPLTPYAAAGHPTPFPRVTTLQTRPRRNKRVPIFGDPVQIVYFAGSGATCRYRQGSPGVHCYEDRPIFARDRPVQELMDSPLTTVNARTTSVIPAPSLLLGATGRTEHHGKPKTATSADWRSHRGRTRENTQVYEGTNQIQRVVMAKKLLG
jgi:hypothetical protein